MEASQPGALNGLWLETRAWFETNFLVENTLVELALMGAAALAAFFLSPLLTRAAESFSSRWPAHDVNQRIKRTILETRFAVLFLLLLWLLRLGARVFELNDALMVIMTSLLTAWVLIRIVTTLLRNPAFAQSMAVAVWSIAALNIVGLLDDVIQVLGSVVFEIGQINVSLLTIIQAFMAFIVLLWFTGALSELLESRINASPNMTPSIRVLSTKLLRMLLWIFAFCAALLVAGVDLTALAVFSGAVGIGLGFGLQKIFANLISGIILLIDRSIKPGDVIAIDGKYGRVDSLGARYVSVTTRDGIDILVPNEEMITAHVENWSHSNNLIRLSVPVGIHYESDVALAMKLCLEACGENSRVLKDPEPVILIKAFGDSSVDLDVRFWIDDPMSGLTNVQGDILLRIWNKFHESNIEIPYPQRDLHIRSSDLPPGSL